MEIMTEQMKQDNARVQQFYNRMDKRVGVEPWKQDDEDFLADLCELKNLQELGLIDKYEPTPVMHNQHQNVAEQKTDGQRQISSVDRKGRMYTTMACYINHHYVGVSPITGHKAESISDVSSNLCDVDSIDGYIEIGKKYVESAERANGHFRKSVGTNFMDYADFIMDNGKAFHQDDIDYLNDNIKKRKDSNDKLYADVYKLEQYAPKMLVTRLQPSILREDTREVLGQGYADYVKEQARRKSAQKHQLKPEPSVVIETESEELETDFNY